LERAGIELRRSKGDGFMHNKFAVIDGLFIYTGSYNHTERATFKNDENYIIIRDKSVAENYERQFQKIWEKHK
jgi:phosphatidylserine/phosphatidylglycerophosphate/cardiolipin synthase-like enzyme